MTVVYRCDVCTQEYTSTGDVHGLQLDKGGESERAHICESCKDEMFETLEKGTQTAICDECGYEWDYSGANRRATCPKSARNEDMSTHQTKTPFHNDYEHDGGVGV